MRHNETPPSTKGTIMDTNENISFAKELGKAVVISGAASAATTAGMFAGLLAVGAVISAVQKKTQKKD